MTPSDPAAPAPWFKRLADTLRGPRAAPAQADPHAGLRTLLGSHAERICNAAQAVQAVRPGDHVFVGGACATPVQLLAALGARQPQPAGVELLHFFLDRNARVPADGGDGSGLRHRTLYVVANTREPVRLGQADYVPLALPSVPALMAIRRLPVDVALVQVSMPDAFGYVSLGVSVDVVAAAVEHARVVIAEINPAMPFSQGETTLHISRIQHLVPVDTPVIEYVHDTLPSEAMSRMARYIASLIDDGSTLQIGLGRVANEALRHLSDRRDLGIHSDVVTDAIIPLLEAGILTGRCKTQQKGRIVASFAVGSRRLYDLIDHNPLFSFHPIDQVCEPATLAAQHKLVSVTQAFAIDLTGQVCTDHDAGSFYGGMAAQAEFLRGASRSPGGKAIICLASTEGDDNGGARRSRIRATLAAGEGVGVARADVHFVVTEFGVAYLFGKSMRERAVALIQIAHPDFRDALFAEAQALGLLPAEQRLSSHAPYAVEDERALTLKGGPLLLRPAQPTDAEGLRQLFHQLPDADVYTRFFRRLRDISNRDMQRLCNVDFEREVAMVAVHGPREHPQVVAHAMYVVDPSTNLAETAFMVHPAWQGQGLGSALQQRLGEHARAHGVRGFVANILPGNTSMLRLAQAGATQVSSRSDGDSVCVTVLFDGPA